MNYPVSSIQHPVSAENPKHQIPNTKQIFGICDLVFGA
jgi:hypothetical protein